MPIPLIITLVCLACFSVSVWWQSQFDRQASEWKILLRWLGIYIVCMIGWWYWNPILRYLELLDKTLSTRPS